MRKVLNVITLIVMLGVNIMNPFTYAISSGDDFEEIQNVDEAMQEDGDFDDEEKIESEEENDEILDEDQDTEEDTDIDEEDENTDEIEEISENTDEEAENKEENNETSDIEQENEVDEDDNQDEETDENNHSGEEIEDDENSTPIEVVDEIVENEIEELSGDIAELTGEVVELTGEVVELTGNTLELSIARETLNINAITGTDNTKGVTVNVEAQPGIFPEGTELRIKPITLKKELNEIKDQIIDSQKNVSEDSELVAFDISFIYTLSGGDEVEVQPKNGEGVKVVFNYENNEKLSDADTNDNQEIKVFHIDDKGENGEKVEKGEEVVKDVTNRVGSEEEGIAVADAESFSIYVVVTTTGSPDTINVTHNLGGGYWMEDYSMTPKTIEYTCDSSCTTNTHYRTPSRTGFMFMGWFTDELGTTKRKGEAEDGMDVYAKWQEFGDLDIIFLGNQSNSGHYTLMDRNMGAKVVYDGNYTSPNDGSRGYYYQWGNNYGFDEYNSNNDPLSPIEPKTENVSSYTSSEPYYSFVFRGKDDQTIKNWMTSLNKKLRGDDGNNEVSRQGPCPDGYHIPTKAEYESILSFYNNLKNNSTEKLTRYLLMPPAGIRDRGYSDLGKVYNSSYYRYITSSWNNNDYTNKAVWFFGADNDNANSIKLDKEWSANGLSARCFKNNIKLNDRYNIYLNGGENAIISVLSGVIQFIQEPYKNFYDFDGWYTSSNFEGDPIEVGSTLLPGSSLYAKWVGYDRYTITYNLNGGFMKFSNNTRESNIQEYAENTNAFTLKNPVKLNSVFIGWSGTNLSSPTLTVTIPKGSVGNRVYEALYDCEPGYVFDENNDCVGIRNADGTLNFDEWEYGTVDFGVGDTKITMLDRNLGATTNDISDSGSIGFYYKWGNNYGFSTNHTSKYGATNTKIADISGYGPGALSGYYLSHDWIYGGENSAAGHWSSIVNFDLWGDITDTLQARQGPCPDEYHIPSDSEVSSVINILSEFAGTSTGIQCIDLYGNKRKCFQNLVKLPDSGLIKSNSSTSSASDTNRIFLRTSSDYNNATMTAFHSTQSQVDMTIGERSSAAAMQVRCFKNINNITVKYNFNGGYYGDNIYSKPDIEDDWYNLNKNYVSPLGLQMKRENSTFSGWYLDAEFTKPFTGGTVFPYVTQDTTFYAKFDCNDGYFPSQDGKSCTPEVASTCNLPWGGTVPDGTSVTGYMLPSQTCPAQCSAVSQVATCNNGSWSVTDFETTYTNSGCITNPVEIPPEYSLNSCPEHGICSSKTGYTVNNNVCIAGNTKYKLNSCQNGRHTEDNVTCTGDTKYEACTPRQDNEKPEHSSNVAGDVTIHWTEGSGWEAPAKCDWICNIHYHTGDDLNSCDIDTFVVTINADVNSGSVSTGTLELEYGTAITTNGNELRVGEEIVSQATVKPSDAQYTHRFVNWTNSCGETITTGCEITANFESTVNKYQITFESNGGSDVKSWTGEYGALVSKPADPTKTGYGFSGWFYEGLETKFDFETTTISGDLTLYAKWTPIIYTISYNYNSGSLTGELRNPSSYTIETDTFTLNNPERVGYDFLGWTGTDFEGLSGTVTIMSGSTGNREYTANWQARNDITLTINHYFQDLDENTNKLKTTYTLSGTTTSLETADDTIILSNYSGNFDGYIYDYGKVDVDGEPVETTTVLPNGSRVINLYYTRKLYSFTLITDAGSTTAGTTPSGSYYYEAKITLSGDINSDCFMWNKWNIDGTTLENNMKQTSFHMPAGNVIAQSLVIEKTYNIVFNGNGATSGEMAELTGLRCTQSVELPINKFEKVGHTFSGWTTTLGGQKEYNDGETIPSQTTGNNVTVDLIAIWDINKYTVTWINSDGSTIKTDTGVEHGTYLEYIGDTPTSGGNAQYTYEFAGWTPEIGEITGNTTYTATYIPTINKYTISWDIDGNIIEEEYEYGDTPNYTGLIHKNSTEQYEYSFSGWNPSISTVEGDKTYTATFTPILRTYTVTWINSDGSGLETDYNIPYGTMPHYDGDKPTKPGDSQHTYTFTGWAPELKIVTGDATYTAIYESIDNKYTVTWQNEDGTPLKIDYDVPYGTIPVYSGTTPTKPSDAQYDYTFDGWSPEPGAVEGDQVYVAKYKPTPRTYTVTWINSDESILLTGKWTYGVTPVYSGVTPTSGGDAQYSYHFIGWNPPVSEVEGDITYTAVYSHTVNTYTVLWKNRDGTVLETGENIPYGVTPTHGDITPTKPSTAQYSYKFIGWEPEISAVTGNISYVAKFDPIVNNYNVKFIDDNGSTLKEIIQYPYGTSWEAIEKPATPTKQQDDQYTYEFAGWTPIITEITGDVTFKATYTSTLRSYTVTWKNRNGTVLKTDENVLYGTMPVYSGDTPTKPSTAQYSYVFTGWDPELSEIHGDVTYTAQFEEATEYYTVTWQNEDGTTLKIDYNLPYGTTPVYSGATPTKSGNIQYDYIFDGWNPDIVPVTSNATYVAKFKSEVKEYTVTWKNRNGTTLEIDLNVPYGSTPSYDGATPTKPSTPQYSYEFDKWTPNVDTVEGNMIYTATFREIINKYVVTWENYDGSVLSSGEVEYGVVPSYSGDTPSKNGDAQYSYTFNGWDKEISQVHEDTIYMATYTQSVNEYLITFKDGDGNTIQTGMVAYGETPIYSGATPTKTADAQYTYTFNNTWNPAIIPVTTGAEYTAQFDKTTNKYTVTIGANSNSGSVSTGIIEVEYGTPITIEGNKLKIGNITITATATGRTAQYTHEFSGWNNSCGISLQSGCTIEAEFRSIVNEYLIIFKDGDGNTIQTGMVAYGETPVYGGAIPTKTADAQYTYTFNNTWSPTIIPVETGAEYTAQFDSTVNKYLITFEDGDGNIIRTGMVAYGEIPVYGGATPTKTATAQYTYIFNNTWSPELTGVTKAQIYAAQFDSIINKYTVTWNNEDGMQLEKDENVPYGSAPSYDGVTPVKPGDDSGNYMFNGWNPTPINVIGDAVYTAKYKEKETPQEDKGNRRSGGGGRKYTTSEEIDQHGSAEDIDKPIDPEKEVFDAYKRAYKYGITTIDNEQEADPDGYVTRGHLAKMVVNFTVNVLGREMPVDTPTKCKRKDKDSEWESNEIKFYAEKASALGVMGLYTEEFMPNKIVDRAEFGTVVSRLLWGNRYDELDTDNNLFYTKHLKALQESGFMKDIDNPLGRKEFRKRVWITLKRIELEKKE